MLVGSKGSFQTGGAQAPPGQPARLHLNILTGKNSLPSQLAWTTASEDAERPGASARLYQTAIDNPLPGQEITHVEFVSLFSKATPFIAALTTESPGSEASPAPDAAPRRTEKKSLEFEDTVYHDELVIHTTDSESSQPLTNAQAALTVSDDEGSFYFGEARSDASGIIRLPYPPQQTVAFSALIRAPGHVPYLFNSANANDGGLTRTADVKLTRGVRIGGVIHDPEGKPLADAAVTIYRVDLVRPREYSRIDHETVRSDRAGKWMTESTPASLENFTLHVEHPEYRATSYSVRSTPDTASTTALAVSSNDLVASKAVLTLAPALRLAGTVLDEAGQAIKDVELQLVDPNRFEVMRSIPCDAQGRFSVIIPHPGDLALMAQASGFRPKLQPVAVEPGMKTVRLSLAKAQPLRGKITDQNQQPIAGARLRLDSWNDSKLLRWQTETDSEGNYLWDSPPDGNMMVYISAANHSSTRYSLNNASGNRNYTLRKLSRVFGRVIDAETKKPIEEFAVIRGHSYNAGEPIRWDSYDSTRGRKGEYSVRLNEYSSDGRSQIKIEAPGYMPQASVQFAKAGIYTNDFKLKKGNGISGIVQLADGTPVANATVAMVERSDNAYMQRPGELRRSGSGGEFQRSNGRGEFQFNAKLEPHSILAAHDLGFAEIPASEVATSGRVVLQPWGRVEGKLRVGKSIDPRHSVYLQNENWRYGVDGRNNAPLYISIKANLDGEGNFVFERVPAGERQVSVQWKLNDRENGRTATSHSTPVTVTPNGTADVIIGGSGRPVIGRMTILGGEPEDADWLRDAHTMNSVLQSPVNIPGPVIRGNMSEEERQQAYREHSARQNKFWATPEGRALQRTQRSYALVFATNGTFRIDNVEPGNYHMNISLTNPERPDNYYEHIGSLNKNVTIPPAPSGKPEEPFDIGLSEVSVQGLQRAGRRAPQFEVKTLDGKTLKLSDFKGKFLFLDFWATWGGTRNLDLQTLKTLHTTYTNDARFVILGLNFDNDLKTAETAITKSDLKWMQSYMGPWNDNRLPAMFGIQGLPDNVLIDPEGKIAGRNLRGSNIRNTVRRLLGEPKQ